VLEKKDIVNFLHVIGFPLFGIGAYVGGNLSPTIGSYLAIFPYLLILLFHLIDTLYQKHLAFKGNGFYYLAMIFLLIASYALYAAIGNKIPFTTNSLVSGRILMTVVPYHAFIVLLLYNGNDVRKVIDLTFISLSLLIAINLIGFFGLGLTNAIHSIVGRINFPFIDSFYSGSGVLIVLNLMMIYYMKKSKGRPLYFSKFLFYFLFNLVLIFFINSRLQILVFLATIILFLFDIGMRSRIMFFVSIFFVPLLLNFTLLLYRILSLPPFQAILLRVNMRDIMTFNGRAQIWEKVMDWILNEQNGLLFGNGYKGEYFIHLVDNIAKAWRVPPYTLHLHSTAFEWLMSTGIIGYGLFIIIMYKTFLFFANKFADNGPEGVFLPVMIFLVWVLQIDALVYLTSVGNLFVAFLWAMVTVGYKQETKSLNTPEEIMMVSTSTNGAEVESVNRY
jgi:O-Antigen ligase